MTGPKRYGALPGVFTPTLLTILGVIMYLRVGWVVGNAGLLGGWLIIALAVGITTATALSLSSIATNTRLGAGGPYAVIRKSLGLEIGGSVGVPLYLSQVVAVAMYIFGLREGWLWLFPEHPALLVDLAAFTLVAGIGWISASLAFRIQYVVMAVIAVSLVLIFASPAEVPPEAQRVPLWGTWKGSPESGFQGSTFWIVFAVFFPAATGVTVGSNMSGELEDPRRSIAQGTLWAVGISSVVYFVLAWWVTRIATAEELVSNYTILIDRALWRPGVLAGLIGATFSSALAAFVGAPRILAAVARDGVIPKGGRLAELAPDGEPRRATAVTAVIVLAALLLRDLNVVAPLVTMFFLIAYAVINLVVLVEGGLGLVSYRPTLHVPSVIPLVGTVGCLFTMFIVNPTFSLLAVGVVMGLYYWLMRQGLESRHEDVRSGLFASIAEWGARKASEAGLANVRAWRPSLLVPVLDPAQLRGEFKLLASFARPEGSIRLLGVATTGAAPDISERVRELSEEMSRHSNVFTTWSVIESPRYTDGVFAMIQALGGAFFRPNVLVLPIPRGPDEDTELQAVVREARRLEVGVMFVGLHPVAGLGRMHVINVWLHPQDAEDRVETAFSRSNLDLAILTSYRLAKAWDCELNLITAVPEPSAVENAAFYLAEICELARLPLRTGRHVLVGAFADCMRQAPQSDLDVFGIATEPDLEFMRRMIIVTRSSCLFMSDSGHESAFA